MKNYSSRIPVVGLLLKMLLFFYLLFLSNRILFLAYFHDRYTTFSWQEIAFSLLYGLRYDTVLALLFVIVPLILMLLQGFLSARLMKPLLITYVFIVLILNCFCLAFDIGIYDLSQIHLNFRILNYIKFLSHGLQFSDPKLNAIYYSMLFAQVLFGIVLGWVLFYKIRMSATASRLTSMLILLFAGACLFGVYQATNSSPFSVERVFDPAAEDLRDLSINVLLNTGYKYLQGEKAKKRNPYAYMGTKEATAIVEGMHLKQIDSSIKLLNTERPNIVLFMLESFTADVIAPLGGDTGVTPNLSRIIADGLLFSNIYSPGYRTDQGLASIINGFPAIPDFSIEMDTEKSKKLPFLTHDLQRAGYRSNLYYGGDIDFANMKAYFSETGIQNLYDSHAFPNFADNPKWGVHDEHVFLKQAREARSAVTPFFSMIISLSSHEPFELPIPPKFAGNDLATKFKNCCFYTDQSIGKYFDSVKNLDWYKNTVFVFMADHGHNFPRNRRLNDEERFHIPMIFYGEPLKQQFRGAKLEQLGMQSDFAATLLGQLNMPATKFGWSNNLMNPRRTNLVYYCFDAGMGWIDKDANMKIDFSSGNAKSYRGKVTDSTQQQAKAYLQVLFDEYLSF